MTLRIKDRARDRYHSLAISSVWSLARLRGARAVVVGAGALGNEVSKNLAMMGVAAIALVDRDTVETANLTRSVFFREADHGRPKTEVLAERLRELNPDVAVLPLQGELEGVLGLGMLRRVDMVFSCLDSRIARRDLNRLCQKAGIFWVDGAMQDLEGEVAVYVPGKTACYECGLTKVDLEIIAEAKSCRGIALQSLALGKVPTTPTMGSIVSALQVQEALKVLHGDLDRSLAGKRLIVNCLINDFYSVNIAPVKDCDGHFRFGEITEMTGWTAASTTAREILEHFERETGEPGVLDLGGEVVTHLQCPECLKTTELPEFRHRILESEALCPVCGHMRVPDTTHDVVLGKSWADSPLARLGTPKLDVLQVRGASGSRWYELSGDLRGFSAALGGEPDLAALAPAQRP